MSDKYYITTTIPYVNGQPHVGHALEFVQADVLARYHRQLGKDVFFLTGTDENSLKNYQAAKEEGIGVQELVDKYSALFKGLCQELDIQYSDFIRTTEPRHIQGAQAIWQACQKDIYKKKYQGLYCLGCEMFFKESELVNGLCPEHKTRPQLIEEENYFFRLSKYQQQLEELIESDKLKIIPTYRRNETLAFIKSGLEDFSISRSAQRAEGWGVPVPNDDAHRMFVWYDALSNYITALGYGSAHKEKLDKYWPADLHCLGKGVSRFHAIYWPAMLISAGLALPRAEFIHGYLTIEGEKISKSLGNAINPLNLIKQYGPDPLRYYLLREFASAEDGDFRESRLRERYQSDLANGLGNLVNRVVALISQADFSFSEQTSDKAMAEQIQTSQGRFVQAMEEIRFNDALEAVWQIIGFANEYIEKSKPWQLIKDDLSKAQKVLSDLVICLREIANLLTPFLPQSSRKILDQINQRKKEPLFPKIDSGL